MYTNQKNKSEWPVYEHLFSLTKIPQHKILLACRRNSVWFGALPCEWHWKPINFLWKFSCDCVSSRHQIGLRCFFWFGHNRTAGPRVRRQKGLCPNPSAVIGDTSLLIESKTFSTGDIWAELSYGTFACQWYSMEGWIKERQLLLEHLLYYKIKFLLKTKSWGSSITRWMSSETFKSNMLK